MNISDKICNKLKSMGFSNVQKNIDITTIGFSYSDFNFRIDIGSTDDFLDIHNGLFEIYFVIYIKSQNGDVIGKTFFEKTDIISLDDFVDSKEFENILDKNALDKIMMFCKLNNIIYTAKFRKDLKELFGAHFISPSGITNNDPVDIQKWKIVVHVRRDEIKKQLFNDIILFKSFLAKNNIKIKDLLITSKILSNSLDLVFIIKLNLE